MNYIQKARKLQKVILYLYNIPLQLNTIQFYSETKKCMLTVLKLQIKYTKPDSKRKTTYTLYRSASPVKMVLYLNDILCLLGDKPLDNENAMWKDNRPDNLDESLTILKQVMEEE